MAPQGGEVGWGLLHTPPALGHTTLGGCLTRGGEERAYSRSGLVEMSAFFLVIFSEFVGHG